MKKEKRDNYTFLTHAPVHHVIFTMAIPTIISMLSTSMYNLADTYFVGSINTQSVAAVGVSFAAMAVIQAIGFFFGHGAGNYVSRQLGAKHTEEAQKMATTGFVLSFLTGLLIAILGHVFLTPICLLMGSTPTILPYTERYLGIILLGAPFMTTSLTLNNLMRFQGNTMYAMKGIMSGVLLNLILAPLLILYFQLGITGAAVATLISQCFGCAMLFWMTHKGENIRIHLSNFTPTRAFAKEIIFGGTPSQIEYAAEMGLEHHLGLTCDPVCGLVQVPCIERNAIAAARAFDANAYATLSDGSHMVSFDKVVEVMNETGHALPSLYRETSEGGLAKRFKR